jgi:pentose-5-phosphate-3-epimerase
MAGIAQAQTMIETDGSILQEDMLKAAYAGASRQVTGQVCFGRWVADHAVAGIYSSLRESQSCHQPGTSLPSGARGGRM